MNLYVTTTALSPDSPMPTNHRRHSHLWKHTLLDACIALINHNPAMELQGLVTPARLSGGLSSYTGVTVQAVPTTILPGHADYVDAKAVHERLGNISQFAACLAAGEVLHLTSMSNARNLEAFGDCEHQLLFERMNIEAPCLVIDGDLLIGRLDLAGLMLDRSMVINNSSVVYLHNAADKSDILATQPQYSARFEAIQSAHLCDGIMWRLNKLGFAFTGPDSTQRG